MSRTLIIAEAGVNHDGDMDRARQLIDAAFDAGADLVKFQTFRADRLVTMGAPKAAYQALATVADESQHTMLRRLELSREMHEELIAHCRARGIGFFSTGFDLESLDLLVKLGVGFFKVPSGEITNLPYLRRVGAHRKQVLLSTGMSVLGDVEAAIEALVAAGTPRGQVTVLHCTTEYPTPMPEVNLRAMVSMGRAFDLPFGYSDHTPGIEVPIAAVALGASVIEKHFTMDRTLPGPDHKASLEPAELRAMVQGIRNIEAALGDGVKRLTASEARNRPVTRKSIVASVPIRKGERLSERNLTVKRPGTGVSPMRWDEVVGRVAARDFVSDEQIVL
jgi:N,N'-diacetyllegionaminate synthase